MMKSRPSAPVIRIFALDIFCAFCHLYNNKDRERPHSLPKNTEAPGAVHRDRKNNMKTLCISEQDASLFSALTEIEERGEIFIICRNGRPVADLIPHTRKSRRVPHPVMSAVRINYDPTETLSPDEWPEGD